MRAQRVADADVADSAAEHGVGRETQMKQIRYRKSEEWTVSEEREFMENLFNQRMNFYIVVYSLVVTGVLMAEQPGEKQMVLGMGIFLCAVLVLSLYRGCHKMLLLLTYLHRTKGHPVRLAGKLSSRFDWPLSVPINRITGVWLPLGTTLFLCAWLLKTTVEK